MSRAHSLHSSASGPNAAGPSHHEHLVLPHHFTLLWAYYYLHSTPAMCPFSKRPPSPSPPLGPHLCILLYTQPAHTSQTFALQQA